MTPQEFCYWLQGFLEMSNAKALDEKQVECVKEHMALVLSRIRLENTTVVTVGKMPPPSGPIRPRTAEDTGTYGQVTQQAWMDALAIHYQATINALRERCERLEAELRDIQTAYWRGFRGCNG